jgi:hypothetical protein
VTAAPPQPTPAQPPQARGRAGTGVATTASRAPVRVHSRMAADNLRTRDSQEAKGLVRRCRAVLWKRGTVKRVGEARRGGQGGGSAGSSSAHTQHLRQLLHRGTRNLLAGSCHPLAT